MSDLPYELRRALQDAARVRNAYGKLEKELPPAEALVLLLPKTALNKLCLEAEMRMMTPEKLVAVIMTTIIKDGLFQAVIDP